MAAHVTTVQEFPLVVAVTEWLWTLVGGTTKEPPAGVGAGAVQVPVVVTVFVTLRASGPELLVVTVTLNVVAPLPKTIAGAATVMLRLPWAMIEVVEEPLPLSFAVLPGAAETCCGKDGTMLTVPLKTWFDELVQVTFQVAETGPLALAVWLWPLTGVRVQSAGPVALMETAALEAKARLTVPLTVRTKEAPTFAEGGEVTVTPVTDGSVVVVMALVTLAVPVLLPLTGSLV